jgi:DNA polymerase, archaea type
MQITEIENTEILFGFNKRQGVVAVEPAGHFMRLFYRTEAGVHFHDEPFQPFILVADPGLISSLHVPCSVRRLSGEGEYRFQLLFDSWGDCLTAKDMLTTRGSSQPNRLFQFLSDLSHQFLLSTGTTLFKGMNFEDLLTFTLDIETYCAEGYGFSNPDRLEDRITSIACRDSLGRENLLRGDQMDEKSMLEGHRP